ncbi:MAG: acetyl/propionyl/methylcrotonyl-CoA carboxylase subunit alpha [Bacteroidales bacterium]
MKQVNKVLVANRGEIAVRIFRTLHQMGIATVAVYQEADACALHVKEADERYLLRGNLLADSYLNIDRVITAAKETGADAIHPGYGFLSENHMFARAVREAGLTFIGPSEEAIELMGHKTRARKLAKKLGIPVIEGATGTAGKLAAAAERIGYPLMVKAAAGGGGKGMRIVESASSLKETLEMTRREAGNYFGNPEIYIEKYLDKPRHIEVQLLADHHGNIISLFERECSIQRRHQKIIEEAPAPGIPESLRNKLMESAKILAGHIGYTNAGTVEFLVKGTDYFFLEMNTRIQVEHPVTEMVTGIDIVREQVNIATGMPLSCTQDEVRLQGHAIEARIYAEDPARGFLPSPGRVMFHKTPAGRGLRIDRSLDSQGEVNGMFDPMLSKVIFHAYNRETARKKILEHLRNYVILGIKTNIAYLIKLLESPTFISGELNTSMTQEVSGRQHRNYESPVEFASLITLAYLFSHTNSGNHTNIWQQIGYWRLIPAVKLLINNETIEKQFRYHSPHEISIRDNGHYVKCRMLSRTDHKMRLEIEGILHQIYFTADNGEIMFHYGGNTARVSPMRYMDQETLGHFTENPELEGDSLVSSPMQGTVIKVMVKSGDGVNKGDTLMILESMKMENKICATAKAVVKTVHAKAGDVVPDSAPLIHLTNDGT